MSVRPLDRSGFIATFVIAAAWGFNQPVVKLVIPDVGPIGQAGLRAALGFVCVAAYAIMTKRPVFRRDGSEAAGLVAGLLFAVEFIALFESVRFTSAARSALFLYVAPFLVAIGAAAFLPSERPRPIHWLGLMLAFAGVAISLRDPTAAGGLLGDALALAAAALWAATTLIIKTTALKRADPTKVLLYQIGVAAILAPPAMALLGERVPTHASLLTLALLLWQGAGVVGATYLVWFRLLAIYPAPQLSAFAFVTPLVGVLASGLILGESVTPRFAAAIALVVGGLALVNAPSRRSDLAT